MISNKI